MTVRVQTLKGVDAGAYYVEHLPSYYLDAGEPPGRWHGRGAGLLDLAGEVDDEEFLSLMAGLHPETGDHLGRRYGDHTVRGFDMTASAPKSVSVLFALGDEQTRQEVLEAHDAAVAAVVDWVEDHAHTRYRDQGEVGVFDAEGIVAASFRQHTSRTLDPQLHTHVVIANRVRSDDGRWLALDARLIKSDQRSLSALYHASLRAELRRRLGVEWNEPTNGIAEIATVAPEVLAEFSTRTGQVEARLEEKLERFEAAFGRQPTQRERWRLEREAVTDSRPAKVHGFDAEELHEQWADQVRALGYEPERVVAAAVSTELESYPIDHISRTEVAAAALRALAEGQSTWRAAEVVRELAAAVPPSVTTEPGRLMSWLDDLAAEVIDTHMVELTPPVPEGMALRRDGRPVSESVLGRALSTPAIVAQEESLVLWADKRIEAGGVDAVSAARRSTLKLNGPQREVAAAVAGTKELALVVGPAGTGKTTAVAPAVAQLRAEGRPVFGVAPSAAAAEVLSAETGVGADTIDKLLIEHRLTRRPQPEFDLPAGATVIVDEAAMVPTDKLAELADLADRRGWRIVLVGDPLQFSAVGRSGMFGHLVECFGAVELDRVRRFSNPWEREASLGLRRGDATVLDIYDHHGRLHSGSRSAMATAVVDAWWQARGRGEDVAMMAPTVEAVAGLNRRAQRMRAAAGEIDLGGRHVVAGGYQIHVGDVVATRRNDRELHTDCGHMVKNRDLWQVTEIEDHGEVVVTGRTGTLRLPADYAKAHVELAYAQTSHANQGRTVDTSLVFIDAPVDTAGVYVPMTRGRATNQAFVVTDGQQTAIEVLGEALAREWIDEPAIVRRDQLSATRHLEPALPPAAPGPTVKEQAPPTVPNSPLRPAALRDLFEADYQLTAAISRVRFDADQAQRDLVAAARQRASVESTMKQAAQRIEWANQRLASYDRPFRRHRHRFDISSDHSIIEAATATIDEGRQELSALEAKSRRLQREVVDTRENLSTVPQLEAHQHRIRARLRSDLEIRAEQLSMDSLVILPHHLGQRPVGGVEAATWDHAAARIEQHRVAFGVTDDRELLGPSPGIFDDAYAASRRAAQEATHALEATLWRDHGIERQGPELSL